jgi:hypothetical protein
MQKFTTLKSIPAYLPIVNIDTDMIIPKSNSAQGACSLEEPHPKFLPAIKIFEPLYGF